MKKSWIIAVLLIMILCLAYAKEVSSQAGLQTIPDEAIRLRILADSDDEEDQRIKRLVRDEVNEYITGIVSEIDDIDVGRSVIKASIPTLEKIVASTLVRENVLEDFTIEYGENIVFPMKVYDQYVYPPGEYEAILITIGTGAGSNWWCVLFPPLCFLDFSNGSTVEEGVVEVSETEEVEVKFFLWEWLGF